MLILTHFQVPPQTYKAPPFCLFIVITLTIYETIDD